MFEKELMNLGFSDKEALVYMTMHKIGPAAASTLARLSRIKRTSIYDVLSSLLERNLINSFKHGHNTYFAIDDVGKLYHKEKERLIVAENVVKKLKESALKFEGLHINHYKGLEGYREMYEDIFRTAPKEFCGWIHLDKFYEGIDMRREDEWTKERIKSGIHVRLLVQNTKLGREFKGKDPESNRECRLIKKGFMFYTTCLIYDGHIVLFSSEDGLVGLRIQHPGFYEMQKMIFEMDWAAHT